jgi:hypothetical protein
MVLTRNTMEPHFISRFPCEEHEFDRGEKEEEEEARVVNDER